MPTPAEVLKDPNFLALPPAERRKVLSKLDRNFSTLPVGEQLKVVDNGSAVAASPAPINNAYGQAFAGSPLMSGLKSAGQFGKGMYETTAKPLLEMGGEAAKQYATPGTVGDIPGMGGSKYKDMGIGVPRAMTGAPWMDMFKGAQGAAQEQFQKGMSSKGSESAGHFAAGALPMIGPAAADVGEHFKNGEIARGSGGMLGLLLPMILGAMRGKPQGEPTSSSYNRPPAAPVTPPPSAPAVSPATVPQTPAPAPAAGAVSRRAFLGKTAGAIAGAATSGGPKIPGSVPTEGMPGVEALKSKIGRVMEVMPQLRKAWQSRDPQAAVLENKLGEELGLERKTDGGDVWYDFYPLEKQISSASELGIIPKEVAEKARWIMSGAFDDSVSWGYDMKVNPVTGLGERVSPRNIPSRHPSGPQSGPPGQSVDRGVLGSDQPPQPQPPQPTAPEVPQGELAAPGGPTDALPVEGVTPSQPVAGPLPKPGRRKTFDARGTALPQKLSDVEQAKATIRKYAPDNAEQLIKVMDDDSILRLSNELTGDRGKPLPSKFHPTGFRMAALQVDQLVRKAYDSFRKVASVRLGGMSLPKEFRLAQGAPGAQYLGKIGKLPEGLPPGVVAARRVIEGVDAIHYDPIELAASATTNAEFVEDLTDMMVHEPGHALGAHDFPRKITDVKVHGPLSQLSHEIAAPTGAVMRAGGREVDVPVETLKHTRGQGVYRAGVSHSEFGAVTGETILKHDPKVVAALEPLKKALLANPSIWEQLRAAKGRPGASGQILGELGFESHQTILNRAMATAGAKGQARALPEKAPPASAADRGGPSGPTGGPGAPAPPARQPLKLPTVPKSLAERTGSPGFAFVERAMESSAPGAKPFRKLRAAQQEALQGMSKAVIDDISSFKGSAEELGKEWQRTTKTAREGLQAEATEAYSTVDDAAGGVQPSTALVKSFAHDALTALSAEGEIVPANARMKNVLTQLTKAPDRVSFRAMADARHTLSLQEAGKGKYGATIRKLISNMDTAMTDAAKRKPGLAAKLAEVNASWQDIHQTFDKSVVARMMEAAPEKVPSFLKGASLDDIDRLAKVTPPETWDAIRGKVVESIFESATEGEGARFAQLKSTLGMKVEPPAVNMRPGSLRKILEDQYGHEKLNRIFKDRPDALANVFKVLGEADKVGHSSASLLGSFITARIAWKTGGAILAGDIGGLVEPAMIALTARTAANLMTKAWGANVMKNFIQVERVAKGTPKQQFWIARMNEAMDKLEKAPTQGPDKKDKKDPWADITKRLGFKAGSEEKK